MRSLSIDFEPPATPTREEQQDALKKGLGRVFPWAISGRLDDDLLLAACLNDYRHDRQAEFVVSPARWVWEILEKAAATQRFRDPILRALLDLPDDQNAYHICTLAYHYAREGDQPFHDQLRRLVDHPDDPSSDLAHEEILTLDGVDGFLRVARVRGTRLASQAWDWDDDWFLSQSADRLGEERVQELLEQSTDGAIKRMYKMWREAIHAKESAPKEPSLHEKYDSIPASRLIAEAGADIPDDSRVFSGMWGRHANEQQLESVFEHLLTPDLAPRVVADLLSVFVRREYPRLDDRLFAFCRHEDHSVRHRAFHALGMVSHRVVRDFAIDELENYRNPKAVTLLIKNFEPGDEERILRSIEPPDDVDHLHWLLMDVIELLERNAAADAARLAVAAYARTPCTSCRHHAYEQLEARAAVPDWMLDEFQLDSYHFEHD